MRYSGSSCRLCRREGEKLYLKGERCFSQKCAITRRNYAPGQHAKKFSKLTEYGKQLREKQKAKRIYNLTETQFHNYYVKATLKKGMATGDLMLKLLELRFDNVLYRSGLADSRNQARQMVSHGLFKVGGKLVSIPSFVLKVGDVFEVADKMKTNALMTSKQKAKIQPPSWLDVDLVHLKGTVKRDVMAEDLPAEVDAQMIVEYYSR